MRRSRLAVRTAALTTLLLAGSVSVWSYFHRAAPEAVAAPAPVSASQLPLYRWTVGEERTYHFVWDDLQRVALPVSQDQARQSMEGMLKLEGELTLQALEVRANGARVRMALKRLERHEASLAGQALFPDAASIQSHLPETASAWLELDARGALVAVRFSDAEPPMFRQLAQTLATELFASDLRDAAEWSAVESTQTGDVEARFQFDDDGARLTRRRARYQSLRAAGTAPAFQQKLSSLTQFDRDPERFLAAVSHDEILDATHTDGRPLLSRRVRLRLSFSSRQQKPLPPATEDKPIVRVPSQVAFEGDEALALKTSQADGMKVDEVLRVLASATDPSAIPELGTFARRAIAALELEPHRAGELGALFRQKGTTPAMRELMLDLLAGAGHPEAQATLRELIASTEAREHPGAHAMMVQRAGFLREPEPETGRLLARMNAEARATGDVGIERASAYALGGVVSHLPAGSPEASELLRPLEDALARADDAESREHSLRALGNSGAERIMDLASPHLRDDAPAVRAAAAGALRTAPQEAATRMLLDALEAESERAVQSAVLDALNARALGPPELERLSHWVVAGRLAPGAEAALLNVLTPRMDDSVAVLRMLQALSTRPGQQPATRARVLALMAQASAHRGG
ncbi:HEAT repeat domain-containing protein [Myxococcus sp. Y35]|uniref:HEAT repeat domain-containing protein n=1 Tax=Pseudomyxococcus flavus TaxID=3115648 RepID=UPI003CEBAC41